MTDIIATSPKPMKEPDEILLSRMSNKIDSALQKKGYRTLADYLNATPGMPYITLAKDLGNNIAAFEIEIVQFEAAILNRSVRHLAIDALSRDLNLHLPNGWRLNARQDFDTVCAASMWRARILFWRKNCETVTDRVWDALVTSTPSTGWTPSGPSDPVLVYAFNTGWPESFHPE